MQLQIGLMQIHKNLEVATCPALTLHMNRPMPPARMPAMSPFSLTPRGPRRPWTG